MSEHSIPAELPSWIAEHVELYLEDPEKAHMWDSTPRGGPGAVSYTHLTLPTTPYV